MTDLNSPLLQYATFNLPRQRVEVKSVWDDESAWITSGAKANDPTTTYYRAVPWIFRGVEMKANAASGVPFRIKRGDTVIDESKTWKNAVGFWPNPKHDIWLVEAALQFGPAYLHREKNSVVTKGLRYFLSSTITPIIDKTNGLIRFDRNIGGAPIPIPVEDMIYFWHPDPGVELGPPTVTPVGAALAAAGVLYNLDAFTAAFWERGAIRATLLTVEGAPNKAAVDELKTWWRKAVSGVKNAFAANVINASAVKPVVIGDGLDSLQNDSLTTKQREDICVALGIPITLMNNTSAGGLGGGGVVSQADQDFYDKEIRYNCDFIAETLNAQIFTKTGLTFEFDIDSLDVFQEDENKRAGSFKIYVDAGLPLEVSGLMLGLELPEGWTWERIANEKAERQAAIAEQMKPAQIAPTSPTTPQDARNGTEPQDDTAPPQNNPFAAKATLDDLRKWRAKSKKRGTLADFESDVIPADVVDTIKAHSDNGWLEALDAAIAGTAPGADKDELTAFERVAFEYVKAADVFAQVLNGTQ